MLAVDKDVPIASAYGRVAKYPWHEMEIGDSFLVPFEKGTNARQQSRRMHGLRSSCKQASNKLGKVFVAHIVVKENGVRIWRIEKEK